MGKNEAQLPRRPVIAILQGTCLPHRETKRKSTTQIRHRAKRGIPPKSTCRSKKRAGSRREATADLPQTEGSGRQSMTCQGRRRSRGEIESFREVGFTSGFFPRPALKSIIMGLFVSNVCGAALVNRPGAIETPGWPSLGDRRHTPGKASLSVGPERTCVWKGCRIPALQEEIMDEGRGPA